jgi:hypothetical protein
MSTEKILEAVAGAGGGTRPNIDPDVVRWLELLNQGLGVVMVCLLIAGAVWVYLHTPPRG